MTTTQKHTPCSCIIQVEGYLAAGATQIDSQHRVIHYCPLHAAAPALLEAAKEALLALRGHNVAAMVEPAERLETAIAQATQAEGRTA